MLEAAKVFVAQKLVEHLRLLMEEHSEEGNGQGN